MGNHEIFFSGAVNVPVDLLLYMKMAIGKFNEYILNYQEAMADAHNEIQSMASLWYAICNQDKEKRARLINKLSQYGQKLAHRTRNNTVLSYTKRRQAHVNTKDLLTTTRAKPALVVGQMEDLCSPKKKRKRRINRDKGTILLSPQALTGGKTNRIIQINPGKERSQATTQRKERRAGTEEGNLRNTAAGPKNSRAIAQKEKNQSADVTGSIPDPMRTKTTIEH